jgi:hypothetical protein
MLGFRVFINLLSVIDRINIRLNFFRLGVVLLFS